MLWSWTVVGLQAKHVGRLRLQLAVLDTARIVEDMDVPGYRLHPFMGRAKNRWSIWVSGNWRLPFEFKDGNAYVLDYEDYHRWLCTILRTRASLSGKHI